MNDDAQLLYRKHTLRRMHRVAQHLAQEKEKVADVQRDKWLQIRTFVAIRDFLAIVHDKQVAEGKADVFNHIRLKLNVFRALAFHTL